jgi:hypothetical protein
MSVRILGAGLVLATLLVIGGCHNNQSRYGAGCCQPSVAAVPNPGCPNCPPSVRAVPPGAVTLPPPPAPVPGFAQ